MKGGGTQLIPGINDITDGVTIDLSQMNKTTLNAKRTTVSIQAGAKWGDVYKVLDPQGYTVAGGYATNVGVAGVTLGGGFSLYRYQRGWTFDNVQNFEIVLGNGTLTNAAADKNTDLFKALKGGLGNLGVVTRIDFVPIKAGPFWGGIVQYNFSDIKNFYQPFVKFTNDIVKDPKGSVIFTWTSIAATKSTFMGNLYDYVGNPVEKEYYNYTTPPTTSSILPAPFALYAFDKVGRPNNNTLRVDSVYNHAYELNGANNSRYLVSNIIFKCDTTVLRDVDNIIQDVLRPYLDQQKPYPYDVAQVEYFPLPRLITDISNKHGGNVLGLDRVKDNSILLFVLFQWSDAAKDQIIQDLTTTILTKVTSYTKSVPGAFRDWQYSGLAYQDQDPIGSYGEANIKFLGKVSKKYDPQQVFQNLVPGGWKLKDAGRKNKQYNFNQFVPGDSN